MRFYALIGASLLLGACAGRAPNPVAVVQPQDRYMDCSAISAEVADNNKRIAALGGEEGGKVAQNVIAGAAGFFTLGITWIAMDFQGTASKEVSALQSRQQYLATLAEQRCGAVVPMPIQNIPAAPVGVPAAPRAATPVSAPAVTQSEMDCVGADGLKFRINGTACPPPSVPAN